MPNRLLITCIDWEYPEDGKVPKPEVWNLESDNRVLAFFLGFANGIYVEVRMVADTAENLELARGILKSANYEAKGSPPTGKWLYQAGDECYGVWNQEEAFVFICPILQPESFETA